MRYLFNEKVRYQHLLLLIELDLSWRVSVMKGELEHNETKEEKIEALEANMKRSENVRNFIEGLCQENAQYQKDENERLQRTERLQAKDL